MNKTIAKYLVIAGITFLSVGLISPVVVSAQNSRSEESRSEVETEVETELESEKEEAKNKAAERKEEAKKKAAERKEEAESKLADKKLKSCQNREKVINNVMSRISDRGQKQLDLFSSISAKTEAFYTAKGNVLSNYDQLLADVNTKKQTAQDAVNTIKSSSATFKCDGTDPKGAASSFKESLKLEIEALKDYKTAVKNLIVGVKSVQSTDTSNEDGTGGDQ